MDAEFADDLEAALRLAGFTPPEKPGEEEEGQYAVVEIMGHRRHVGRVIEAERFGARMLRVDVPKPAVFDEGFTSHFYGGASIFGITPTDRATAEKANHPRSWDQPQLFHAREEGAEDAET